MKEVKKSILLRVYLVYLGILLFGLLILGRVIYIQSFEKESLIKQAKQQKLQWFEVEAIRGNICTEDGTLLATSIPIFEIRMDLSLDSLTDYVFRKHVDSLAIGLSGLFRDKSVVRYRDELWEARRNREKYYLIQRNVTYSELETLRNFPIFRRGKYKGGLIVEAHYRRELPYNSLARRTIGYERAEEANKIFVGLEGYFSQELKGKNGTQLKKRVGNISWIPIDMENQLEPQNGDDIITSLDINLQDLAETALRNELKADSAEHGCVIIMEVSTGYIKAIANLGRIGDGSYEEIFNYAVGECSEPGSTFKLASFLVALEDGKIDLNTLVETGNGVIKYRNQTIKDSHHGGYGTITAKQVFEKSSNVGTSQIIVNAYGSEPQKFIDGLYRLSIHKSLGLQINGEGIPQIKDTRSRLWSSISLPMISIGYEILLTPLQILTLYNAIANDGKMVKPLFVREIRRNGQVIQSFSPEVINPAICSPLTIAKAKILLKGVVDHGTAEHIRSSVYTIGGKTGTAQLAQNNKGYGKDAGRIQYNGSFVGFFPIENPQYSCIVVIHNPGKKKYYGGDVAAPVFREVSDHLYAGLRNISNPAPPDSNPVRLPYSRSGKQQELIQILSMLKVPAVQMTPDEQWANSVLGMNQVKLLPREVQEGLMPNVVGMGLKDAVFLLEQAGLRVVANGKGTVVWQSVPSGETIGKGQVVEIELGMLTEMNTLPL